MGSKKIFKSVLNVQTDISSDKIEDPSVIDPTGRINIVFNEDINISTLSDGIKLYKVESDCKEVEINVKIDFDGSSLSNLYISKSDNSELVEGEEYKLSINNKLKSISEASLKDDFTNYFALDYSFNLDSEGILDLNNKRTMIVCISDMHLGANDIYTEINKNRDSLIDFLNHIRISPNVRELVIAGDLIDEWFVPMNLDTFNGKTQLDFVKSVAYNNKSVIDAFNNIINDGKVSDICTWKS